jgi:apolipoprotein N-acyltransferase
MKIYIDIKDSRWKNHKIDFVKIANAAYMHGTLRMTHNAEISIILTDDSEIRKLNKKYRGIDKATNVLSFETGDPELLGDIYISYDTVMKELGVSSEKLGVDCSCFKARVLSQALLTPHSSLLTPNFIEHTAHMVVHGVLHLLGYDHLDDKKANKMEKLESKVMKKLGYDDPYFKTRTTNHEPRFGWLKLLLAGLIASFGFAPFYLWPLTVVGLGAAYLIAPVENKFWKSYGRGFWFGAGYGVAMFWWVLHSIFVDAEMAARFWPFALPGLIGIAIGGGIVFGLPFAILGKSNVKGFARPVAFAGAITLVLFLREFALTGFPWNPLANIMMPYPVIANSMSLWGALGLTFVLAGIIAAGAELITWKKEARPLFLFVPLLIVGALYGSVNILNSNAKYSFQQKIRIVQPSLAQSEKLDEELAEKKMADLIALSKSPEEFDIVIWPETASPFFVLSEKFDAAREIGKPVIAGAMSYKQGKFFNSMIVADKEGAIKKIYHKSHLVPFGEYDPSGFVPVLGNLTPGGGPEVIDSGAGFSFAPAICYEIIFSDSLTSVGSNPNVIINITNDTWFGLTPGPYQHLDMTRRYAIESGLPVIRANFSGISAFIDPAGKVIKSMPIGEQGVLDGQIYGAAHVTPYRKLGINLWFAIIMIFSMSVVLISKYARRKKD